MNDQIKEPKAEQLTGVLAGASIPTKPTSSRSTQQALKERNKRTKRIPLANQRALTFEQDPKFHYREVVDQGGRIEMFKKAGYEFDEKPDSEKESRSKDASNIGKYRNRIVGTTDSGQEIRAWMMRIPIEWYEEDQKAKQNVIDKQMRTCKHTIHGIAAKDTYGEVRIDEHKV